VIEPPAQHPGAVLGLLADQARMRCLAAVVLGALSEAEVTEATGLPERVVRRSLRRLIAGGLVGEAEGGRLNWNVEALHRAAVTASGMRPEVTPESLGAGPEQASVLRNFMQDGRLARVPVQRAKRRSVLDLLAQQFEPGRRYPEREVNAVLARFHPDYAALRRFLVDEEFLERREGSYWRAGGTFEID
jgi:hypothetical protein